MQSGLDIVSLPSHTSHALQPLDVACFKPFKTAFRRCRDLWSLENYKEVGKQELCEWTSRALKASLTPNNIRAGFRSTGIWPLDRTVVRKKMHVAVGFEVDVEDVGAGQGSGGVTRPVGNPGAAIGDGQQPVGHHGKAIRLAGSREPAELRFDVGPASIGAESDSAHDVPHTEIEIKDNETNVEVHLSSPGRGCNDRPLHYYVDVPDAKKSTYDACDKNVGIDPSFHVQLQEENEHDISTFLALLELIPARKRKRQQPLLDFTKSKILTSQAYTEGCERLLVQ